jgi:hypothetical protein
MARDCFTIYEPVTTLEGRRISTMLGLVRMISCYEAYNIEDTMHAALPERILRSRGLLQLDFPARLFLELRLRDSFRPRIPQP